MKRVVLYARVSTQDQSVQRQVDSMNEYVDYKFRDENIQVELYKDESTGANTERDGFQAMMGEIDNGKIDAVVVKSLDRLTRSLRDLENIIEDRIEPAGSSLHLVDSGLTFSGDKESPGQKAQRQMLGVFAEWERSVIRLRTKEGIRARMESEEEYHHGRPPIGYESENGKLYKSDNYDEICATLEMVDSGEMSQRQAAKELDISRAAVKGAIEERGELYGL